MKKGTFIVFEGIDGCGKGTQVKRLAEELGKRKIPFITTFEHTRNSPPGKLIEKVVNHKIKMPILALEFLFVADRLIHLETVIEPALKQGKVVIADRYSWSTVAYGSLVADKDWLFKLHRYCRSPDLTILLKANPKNCVKRISSSRKEKTIFEKEKRLRKIWKAYQWLAEKYPQRALVVNGEGDPKTIGAEIWRAVENKFFS